jgi:hypothetical protein
LLDIPFKALFIIGNLDEIRKHYLMKIFSLTWVSSTVLKITANIGKYPSIRKGGKCKSKKEQEKNKSKMGNIKASWGKISTSRWKAKITYFRTKYAKSLKNYL